ncbi:hypothetical protein KL930_001811 [Ogataea haglerorum]|uniref:RGS domain-containing protein n=1 Tax=Ogataea haglerorum TaxID=1937702 RepID=A0AAN6D920_9ASCO|nr:uncharacterized protein KL911_001752 [Ogataea haglerorum]KAG7698149.1 hypothetical protein KL915_001866 [Ogataea haglerorum]KAG7699557.1 hypothetical protein KL951_001274 [Ogataea haglerorum]KAG7708370.1 hypothetical protein KL914_002096 [Ogataea haglerorum]KAG7710602.1 hypothetical protein KL950_001515 [Ogataea haglerorum]KAG7730015.1 hypothetical protein KL933_001095 [Ogataea haglerorum]
MLSLTEPKVTFLAPKSTSVSSSEEPMVPKLDSVLGNKVPSDSLFSKAAFSKFLLNKHCLENLEFYQSLQLFIENHNTDRNVWKILYEEYFENNASSEINLPGDLKAGLSGATIPDISLLQRFLSITKHYLHDSYQEFTRQVIEKMFVTVDSSSEEDDTLERDETNERAPSKTHRNQSFSSISSAKSGSGSSWAKWGKKLRWRRSSSVSD